MKTKKLIQGLRDLRHNFDKAKSYDCLLRLAAERLEELATGKLSVSAEIAKRSYTTHELARMYDLRCEYCQELYTENLRLKLENEELRRNEMQSTENQ
jgi:regulator of replication initiation timing